VTAVRAGAPTGAPTGAAARRAERAHAQDLWQHRRRFFGRRTTQLATLQLVGLVAWRLALGGWTWADLLVVAALVALEPFTEWVIHVFVLHWRPRVVAGRTVDLHAARKHRAHHADPHDPDTAFVPLRDYLTLGAIITLIAVAVLPGTRLTLTALLTGACLFLTYEWTHYLVHTAYRPRGRYYRSIWRAHRLHHFRNEHYWMGVTVNLADHVLGTFPDKSAVPLSPTARTLGVVEA
jgi:hypothetical protein